MSENLCSVRFCWERPSKGKEGWALPTSEAGGPGRPAGPPAPEGCQFTDEDNDTHLRAVLHIQTSLNGHLKKFPTGKIGHAKVPGIQLSLHPGERGKRENREAC